MRVLYVDNDPASRALFQELLAQTPFTFHGAETPEQALDLLRGNHFLVIVCEYELGGTDGIEFLSTVRRFHPNLGRILVTGINDLAIAEKATHKASVQHVLKKPLSLSALQNALEATVAFQQLILANSFQWATAIQQIESTERELGHARSVLDHLLNTVPVGVLGLDQSGIVNLINRCGLMLIGRSAEEVVGRKASDFGFPCSEFCTNRQQNDAEVRQRIISLKCATGEERNLLLSCESFENNNHEIEGCLAAFQDITQQQQLELRVFHAKQEIETLFDSIIDPLFLVDRNFILLRVNQAYLQFCNLTFEKVLGKPCYAVSRQREAPCPNCTLALVFERGEVLKKEFKAGEHFFLAHYFPCFHNRKVEWVTVRYQEITAEKLLSKKLIQSEKMAAIGQLSAGIAHEINNPTGYILSNLNRQEEYTKEQKEFFEQLQSKCEQARNGETTPESFVEFVSEQLAAHRFSEALQDSLDIIEECQEGGKQIRNIVTNLKAFSHPGENRAKVTADLNRCLENTINLAWNELKYKCEVVRDYGEIPVVVGNPQQLNQVFLNLLVNAAQAIETKGTVTVRTRRADEMVVVRIEDTGVGIPPDQLQKVFEPFFTTKPIGKGTGLGLHLAAGIVNEHGGRIEVESEPGKGTTFSVYLPLTPPNPKESGKDSSPNYIEVLS